MDMQRQERTCQHKFPPKSIETEKPGFSVKCVGSDVKRSDLYTGQILALEVEGNRSRDRPKKCWLDIIRNDLRLCDLQAETCQNRSEWKERLKTVSHTHWAGNETLMDSVTIKKPL